MIDLSEVLHGIVLKYEHIPYTNTHVVSYFAEFLHILNNVTVIAEYFLISHQLDIQVFTRSFRLVRFERSFAIFFDLACALSATSHGGDCVITIRTTRYFDTWYSAYHRAREVQNERMSNPLFLTYGAVSSDPVSPSGVRHHRKKKSLAINTSPSCGTTAPPLRNRTDRSRRHPLAASRRPKKEPGRNEGRTKFRKSSWPSPGGCRYVCPPY